MKQRRRSIIFSILLGLFTVLISILGNLLSGAISSAVIPYAWPLLGMVLLAGIGLTVWHVRRGANLDRQDSQVPILSNQNRQRMLAKVRAFWITGVLEKSLHGAALITLGLQERQDALTNPLPLVFQQIGSPAQALPSGTHIAQIYDSAGGELLILGEPGSGKTTLLLELTRVLLERAERDDNHPIPVVFNLASWAAKSQPIADWLVEELNVKYQVPRVLGHAWVSTDQIIPLLDGLDEVSLAYRESCIEAFNSYRREHMVSIVVCSRRSDYFALTKRIMIHSAIAVQPLTPQQINDYLSR